MALANSSSPWQLSVGVGGPQCDLDWSHSLFVDAAWQTQACFGIFGPSIGTRFGWCILPSTINKLLCVLACVPLIRLAVHRGWKHLFLFEYNKASINQVLGLRASIGLKVYLGCCLASTTPPTLFPGCSTCTMVAEFKQPCSSSPNYVTNMNCVYGLSGELPFAWDKGDGMVGKESDNKVPEYTFH